MHRLLLGALGAAAVGLAVAGAPAPAVARPAVVTAIAACPTVRMPATEADTVFTDLQVDRQVKPRRNNPEVPWPSESDPRLGAAYASRARGFTSGTVELRFVVDKDGCADMRTVKVVASTDTAFTLAVMDVLPKWTFEPARKDGRNVAQLYQLRWELYRRNGARMPGQR